MIDIKEKGQNITYKVMFGLLISIVGFFAVQQMNKLTEIQKDIVQLQKTIVQMQVSVLTRQDVKEIARDEIVKYNFEKGK